MLLCFHKQNTLFQLVFNIAILFPPFVLPTLAADFDAKSFFRYFDESCNTLEEVINLAGGDMNDLFTAAQNSFNWTPLSKSTFASYWGQISSNLAIKSFL